MRTPVSTYRLQIRPSFTLQDAAALTAYLRELGVDWVYLSPILTAEEGSDHGYDVTDPSTVDASRGGVEGLAALSKAAREAGLGVLVDIVPNHMGVASPPQNAWWWSLLKEGRASRYAEAFDVDWDFGGGKLRLPVLGSDHDVDKLEVVDGELRYFDHRFPLAEGSYAEGDNASDVHARQHYELVGWRRADDELNYRRFFAVNTLAGIRVEIPWVFDEAHAEIARWFQGGLVDGLRIDHPDGLADPAGYLERLKETTAGSYLLVEKILEPGEELPENFDCEGTTGYDALADVDRLFVDPDAEAQLDALDARLRGTGSPADYQAMIHGTKRRITDGILHSEILRLARLVPDSPELPNSGVASPEVVDALAEIIASFHVYRSYLPYGKDTLVEAVERAARTRPELEPVIKALLPLLLEASHELGRRFQQTSGMVMAKGVEDTAFFRYTRLGTLTEVGADPTEFALSAPGFHERMVRRQALLPLSMTTLTTHDTKRSEDTRARISAISEAVPEWEAFVDRMQELAPIPDGPLAALVWQAIAGAWPASRERLQGYVLKAAREAGNSTSWTEPNEAFEATLASAVDAAFDMPELTAALEEFVALVDPYGKSNSLSAKVVQLTMPGVPDVYQGTEFWDRSLTDPDNRRAVDFERRKAALAALDAGVQTEARDELAKLLVTSRALRLRRDRPELFGGYSAVDAQGHAAEHLIAFDRGALATGGGAITLATRLPRKLERNGGWQDTFIRLGSAVRDELTGNSYPPGEVHVARLLQRYPVALLEPIG
ncbi:malto-oligosyltrehalose synthase [Arthrobacter bambusae]|uniref:(1->4)-alpha-D-glucan 1-alpha-D-glucosylmutase n=1 Tax=Arthrobacter bambusae TaxID=1338426 RepID=A0AAW8DA84_9MICC|nr:malto-oligosyltrehalose synthase [Arthrobacter bambusae]MDP9903388.1 (1->4)-alpha-D-glucan 1-alpha-D-glucosylmutase [Arthrobacter bambusae]MDQ0128618.1 (1->4)-alpha-D-glucan 1-alpha-D-glucosylmutase [Arthrobacter bambusae]MDQ0179959.1 (1->4)-alpha-D-glucan 1-alpha-D-glucosylmutase [Arthrobacter bambusae]